MIGPEPTPQEQAAAVRHYEEVIGSALQTVLSNTAIADEIVHNAASMTVTPKHKNQAVRQRQTSVMTALLLLGRHYVTAYQHAKDQKRNRSSK